MPELTDKPLKQDRNLSFRKETDDEHYRWNYLEQETGLEPATLSLGSAPNQRFVSFLFG